MIGELIVTGDTYNDGRIAINYAFSGEASFNGFSANTMYSGSTNLYDIFGSNNIHIQNGTNTYTGGTNGYPTINVSAATLDRLTVSGDTDLQAVSSTTIYASSKLGVGVSNPNETFKVAEYVNFDLSTRMTSLGYKSGIANSGNDNVFVGYFTGTKNTSGEGNTFIGYYAGYLNTTGSYNVFNGNEAGYSNTSGVNNIFHGYQAGNKNIDGNDNTFIGYESGFSNSSGDDNVFVGSSAGYKNTIGNKNVAVGKDAGYTITDGANNTMVGYHAGYKNNGGDCVFLGYMAGYNETGSSKLYIENSDSSSPLIYGEFHNDYVKINGELEITDDLTVNGETVLQSTTATTLMIGSSFDSGNIFEVENFIKFSGYNSYLGYSAGTNNVSGNYNTLVGYDAGYEIINAAGNTMIGTYAGYGNKHGNYNTIIGVQTLYGEIGDHNIAIGINTAYNMISGTTTETSAEKNIIFGNSALYNTLHGHNNVVAGYRAGYEITAITDSVIIGSYAGHSSCNTTRCVFIGYNSGYNAKSDNLLYIENSDTDSPLIGGNFSYNRVGINHDIATLSSTLNINGSIKKKITLVTANTTLNGTYYAVLIDTTSGNVNITLPDASSCEGREYKLKWLSSANTASISTYSSQTVDNSSSFTFSAQYESTIVQAYNGNWYIF